MGVNLEISQNSQSSDEQENVNAKANQRVAANAIFENLFLMYGLLVSRSLSTLD